MSRAVQAASWVVLLPDPQLPPQPEPGWDAATGVNPFDVVVVTGIVVEEVDAEGGLAFADTPCVGVIDTSWKIPETGWKTTTIA